MSKWIKRIDKSLLDWELYDNPNAVRLFIHIILKSNKNGELKTSYRQLANETGLSLQVVRNTLSNIVANTDLICETTSNGTVLRVVKLFDNTASSTLTNTAKNKSDMQRLEGFIKKFNQIRGTEKRASANLLPNFKHWLSVYTPHEMVQAIKNSMSEDYWAKDILTPTILLRRKNKSQEPVDYIGDLLSQKQNKPKTKPQIKVNA